MDARETSRSSRPAVVATHYAPPIPIELPRPGFGVKGGRLIRTLAAMGRHVVPALGRRLLPGPAGDHSVAHAFRLAFEELGATYVKFGQFVGSAPAIVGDAAAAEFRSCLDKGPAVAFADVRRIVESDLKRPFHEAFASFDKRPFAAASIAVVHRATLADGREVAVKVLRPGMDEVVAADLALMESPVRFLAGQGSDTAMNLLGYLIGLREQIAEELDLRNEARSMVHFRELFARLDLSLLVVPRVHEALCGRRVLTMELLDGVPIDDLVSIRELGIDPRPLVQQLMRAWILTAAHHGAFHADIHAGNLLLLRDGRLGMVDWGIVARLDPETHRLLYSLLEAAIGNASAWDDIAAYVIKTQGASLHDGLGLSDAQVLRLVRAQMEPLLTRPVGEVSMASVFGSTEDAIVMATGEAPPRRSPIERLRLLRKARRAARLALAEGVLETDFKRAGFLAGKQLVYLERYWKMYLPELPVLGDHEFLRAVLAQERPQSGAEEHERDPSGARRDP